MSAFDTARDMRMPGVVLGKVYIDPKLLTTRMKNAVKKMLREGMTHGGWGSKSKQIAKKLSECYDLRIISSSEWGFTVPPRHTYDETHIAKVIELIDADEALEVMDDAQANRDARYVEQIIARTRERHEDNRNIVRGVGGGSRWMRPGFSKEIKQQIVGVFTSTRTPELIAKAQRVIDMIDNNEPIEITIDM